jgi:hypothetical protein
MVKGLRIDYRIKIQGIPMKWKTEITHWNPPFSFQDTQQKGPYLICKYLHVFAELGNSTLMTDKVYYRIPGYILEPLIYRFFVRKQLQQIFDYRQAAIQKIFSSDCITIFNN